MTKYIGQRTKITTEEIKERYITLGKNNEKAAKVLEQQGLYNEAVFMYIQAMEKKIKGYICGKINSENPYFARKIREMGHSLDSSVDFLIEILSGNDENLKAQLSKLLREEVFQNLRFSTLYNECRYPRFDSRTNTYSVVHITKIDCKRVADMNMLLDKYMCGFDRL